MSSRNITNRSLKILKINIVIPYRTDPNNGLELKYALRSIEKYLAGYNDIFIVGDCPKWVRNVKHIDCREESAKLAKNILNKILHAFTIRDVGEDIIQWQDDIFLTMPLRVEDIKYWYEGSLEQAIFRHHGNYKAYIENTAKKITEGKPYFDIHAPIIYNIDVFQKLAATYDWQTRNFIIKSLYCDLLQEQGVKMHDCKISGPMRYNQIKEKINGSLFFSTSPQGISDEMVEIFEELYPEKSKFE